MLAPDLLKAELEAANVPSIYARWQIGGDTAFFILGLDQKLRLV